MAVFSPLASTSEASMASQLDAVASVSRSNNFGYESSAKSSEGIKSSHNWYSAKMPAKKKPTAKERLAARKAAANAPATTRIVLVGFGDVGKNVAELLISTKTTEYNWAGVPCAVVAVADSRGAVYTDEPRGFDLSALLRHKRSGASVHTYGGEGAVAAVDAIVAVNTVEDFDVLFEASPVNLETGGVGLAGVKAALAKGKDAVLANKAPLVLAYAELHAAAAAQKCRLEFSATVCGGLPVSTSFLAAAKEFRHPQCA
eukprot:gene19487-22911_t